MYILQSNTRTTETSRFAALLLFFFLRESTNPRKLQHYRSKFAQPGLPIVTPCLALPHFLRCSSCKKASFRAEFPPPPPPLSLYLSLPFYSLDESQSGAVLPSCARTFKWRASTLKKAVPQPFVWRCECGSRKNARQLCAILRKAGDCLSDERNYMRKNKKTKEDRV